MHESYEYRYAWERNDEVYLEVLIGLLLNIEGPSQASEEVFKAAPYFFPPKKDVGSDGNNGKASCKLKDFLQPHSRPWSFHSFRQKSNSWNLGPTPLRVFCCLLRIDVDEAQGLVSLAGHVFEGGFNNGPQLVSFTAHWYSPRSMCLHDVAAFAGMFALQTCPSKRPKDVTPQCQLSQSQNFARPTFQTAVACCRPDGMARHWSTNC